jgi:hypothetical protein
VRKVAVRHPTYRSFDSVSDRFRDSHRGSASPRSGPGACFRAFTFG